MACTTAAVKICKWLLQHSDDNKIPNETELNKELLLAYEEWFNLVERKLTRSYESAERVLELIPQSMCGIKKVAEFYGWATSDTTTDELDVIKERSVCSLHKAISEAWNIAVERNDNRAAACLTIKGKSVALLFRATGRAVLVDSHGKQNSGERAYMATYFSYLDMVHDLALHNQPVNILHVRRKEGEEEKEEIVIPHDYDLTVFVLENDSEQ